MTIKFSRAANSGLTAPDSESFTLPANFTLGFILSVEGWNGGTEAYTLISNGPFASGSSNFNMTNAAHSYPNAVGFTRNGSTALSATPSPILEAGGKYLIVFERSNGSVKIRWTPVRSTAPVDGSGVLSTGALTNAPIENGLGPFRISGDGSTTRANDHALGRVFIMAGTLTDLEIARLAYGEDIITQLGKTVQMYVRMDTPSDIIDRGPNANVFTATGTLSQGADVGFGYVPPSPPVFTTAPEIDGGAIQNTPVSYIAGTVAANPAAAITQQWTLDGVDIAGATDVTYTPVAGDVGKNLRVRQTATNTNGSASSTSLPVTVAAYIPPPTGTVSTDYAPSGQSKRYAGTTTNATTGSYTLTGSNGGTTVTGTFDVVANVFDFTVDALVPGSYSPTLTVTGPNGTASVSGAGNFNIVSVGGGGELPGGTDTTAPTVTAATVTSATPGVVVLTSSEPLDANSVPAASAFTVSGHTVQSVAIQGSAINLTVTPAFANGEAPRTVAYVQPASGAIRDLAATANLLASFSGLAVSNNVAAPVSTVTGVTINPTAATVAGGATQTFTATAQGTNSPAQTFTWTRNHAVGAITGNGTATGSFTAPAATNVPQVIEVTATSTQDPNYSAKAVVTVPAAAPAGTNFTRSIARTIKVKPAPQMFEGGPFWNTTNKTRPVGTIDKDETIDVSFDLTEVLADIADTVKQIDFDLAGLTSVGGYFTGAVATVFVSNAVSLAGGKNPSITCRMTTNSTPPRVEDWTVELKIEEQ